MVRRFAGFRMNEFSAKNVDVGDSHKLKAGGFCGCAATRHYRNLAAIRKTLCLLPVSAAFDGR
jgi:hypothetical protein